MKYSRIEKNTHFLALPGCETWELWEFGANEEANLVRSAENPAALNLGPRTLVCIPSSEVCTYALVLATTDRKLLNDMAALQMEARGLVSKSKDNVAAAVKSLRVTEGHTLCLAVSTPRPPKGVSEIDFVSDCSASFEAIPFEDNAITIWKELGAINATVKSRGSIVAIQRLSSKAIDENLISEIICLVVQLELEAISEPILELVIWDGIENTCAISPAERLPFSTREAPRPQPIWPDSPVDLLLPRHKAAVEARARQARLMKAVLATSLVALAGLFLLIVNIAWLFGERFLLEAGNQNLRPKIAEIRQTALRWDMLGPALNPNRSALETFYQIVRCMPSADISLTLFQLKDGQLVIEGESQGASRIAEFENRVSKTQELSNYAWTMPPPVIKANNIAHFQMTGQIR